MNKENTQTLADGAVSAGSSVPAVPGRTAHRSGFALRSLGFGLALSAATLLLSVRPAGAGEDLVTINMAEKELDVVVFMETASQITKKSFIYDPQLKGKKVSVIFPRGETMTREKALKLFLAMLDKQNYSVTDYGDFVKVVPLDQVRTSPQEMRVLDPTKPMPPLSIEDRMLTLVYPLKYADATRASSFLAGLINRRSGSVVAMPESNLLVISDFSANLDRLLEVLRLLDVKAPEETLEVVQLKNVPADEMAQKLAQIIQAKTGRTARQPGKPQTAVQITAFPRTNSLVLLALPDDLAEIKKVIEILDVPFKVPAKVHVYQLKNTKAEDLAKVLQQIYGATITAPPAGVQGTQPAYVSGSRTPIVADPHTNSLIITCDEEEFSQLSAMIQKLDVRRPQVVIEGAIVELTQNLVRTLAAELAETARIGNTSVALSTGFGLSKFVEKDKGITVPGAPGTRQPTPSSGLFSSVRRGQRRIPLLISALETTGEAKVLAHPSLLTNDNQKASFKSTDQEPTRTTNVAQGGEVITSFGGFQEAGITLEITPHISAGSEEDPENAYLQLEILQRIEGFTGERDPQGVVPPPKFTREVQTVVTVPNEQLIVLGGLTRRDTRESVNGVPLLKDIPVLGYLFRRSEDEKKEHTLYVFISPRIMTAADFRDMAQYTNKIEGNLKKNTGVEVEQNPVDKRDGTDDRKQAD